MLDLKISNVDFSVVGYTKYENESGISGCYAPSVGIARYLNGKHYSISMFGDEFVSSFKTSARTTTSKAWNNSSVARNQ